MYKVIFSFNQIKEVFQCDIKEKMKEICEKFATKIKKKNEKLFFLYNGDQIQQNLLLEQLISSEDKKTKTMAILVNEADKNMLKDKLVPSNEIICPECQESIFLNITNFKINLSGCKNSHNFNNLTLNEFENKQKYNLSGIICKNCIKNNKGNTDNNIFFRCISCGKNLCPNCERTHNKEHKIINYDNKNYICHQHNENYIKYCKECKQNLCIKCEANHIKHDQENFGGLFLDVEKFEYQMKNLEKTIGKFKDNIQKIIQKLNNIINLMDEYYNMSNKIFNNYKDQDKNKNRNYHILKNINHIDIHNKNIMNEINRINNESNIYNKIKYILELFDQNYTKDYLEKINYKFNSNPDNLKFKLDVIKSNDYYGINDIFEIFISYKDNKEYIVSKNFDNFNLDIIRLSDNKIINSLKGHKDHIISVRYFINNKNHKEYLVSSDVEKKVIIWNITKNYKIKKKIKTKYLNDIYFLLAFPQNNIDNFLVTSSECTSKDKEESSTIIYPLDNLENKKYIEQTNKMEIIYLLLWNNLDNQKYYIIQFSTNKILINNLIDGELYSELENQNAKKIICGFIYNRNYKDYLCSSSQGGLIIIWDLLKKRLFKIIEIDSPLMYIIPWNDKYIIVADYKNRSFKIIDMEQEKVISEKKGCHKKEIKCIKKIKHPKYGESLLTAARDQIIKLWII